MIPNSRQPVHYALKAQYTALVEVAAQEKNGVTTWQRVNIRPPD